MNELAIKRLTKQTKTRYMKRANALKSSNFYFELDTYKAYSYNWWLFTTRVNGLVIFNNTTYSSSTNKHQSKALSILDYKYDLKLTHTTKNLTDLAGALNDEIVNCKAEILDLIATIKKPRTRKSTNQRRKETISKLLSHINKVRNIRDKVL